MNNGRSSVHTTWARVEDDFYVGSRFGEFLGYVDDAHESHAMAWDMLSRPLGQFGSLDEAMEAVQSLPGMNEGGSDDA
ncbi:MULTISPECIES: hypothetical protein [unclassified Leucobacter]|uniref:hypothetical protein n=1 Tax=unclassified Leucobacter TaxID=2621730 RepID=UPI003015BAC0